VDSALPWPHDAGRRRLIGPPDEGQRLAHALRFSQHLHGRRDGPCGFFVRASRRRLLGGCACASTYSSPSRFRPSWHGCMCHLAYSYIQLQFNHRRRVGSEWYPCDVHFRLDSVLGLAARRSLFDDLSCRHFSCTGRRRGQRPTEISAFLGWGRHHGEFPRTRPTPHTQWRATTEAVAVGPAGC
jgi:hypothetical protein